MDAYFWSANTKGNRAVAHGVVALEDEPYSEGKEDRDRVDEAKAFVVVLVDVKRESVVVIAVGHDPAGGSEGKAKESLEGLQTTCSWFGIQPVAWLALCGPVWLPVMSRT